MQPFALWQIAEITFCIKLNFGLDGFGLLFKTKFRRFSITIFRMN